MRDQLVTAIERAFDVLIENDGELFGCKINEKEEKNARKLHEICINSKLANYLLVEICPLLKDRKQEYFSDIEFNRNGEAEKAVMIDGVEQIIRPDIIIHNRKSGEAKSNFLVSECKKNGCGPKDIEDAIIKILGVMNSEDYKYEYGLFVKYLQKSIKAIFYYKEEDEIKQHEINC